MKVGITVIELFLTSLAPILYEIIKNKKMLKQLNTEVDKHLDISKMSKSQQIMDLSGKLNSEELVLVLGAGVSTVHGIPQWNTLLQKLLIDAFIGEKDTNEDKSRVLAKLFTETFNLSPLIAARYLRKYYQINYQDIKGQFAFEEAIRNAIYAETNFEIKSELFKEIRQLCIAPGKSPNLDSIITYNYDDILEMHLSELEIDIPFKSIYSVGMNPSNGELPIYHVHGFLPREGNLNEKNRITLSEDIYHQQYNDIYSWNNNIQINKFTNNTCLFIGLSFTDPNLRRLLDIANIQRGNSSHYHYLIKIKNDINRITELIEKILKNNPDLYNEKQRADLGLEQTVKYLLSLLEKFEEQDALSFGVKTIWIEDFSEIPIILKQIRTEIITE